MEKEEDVIHNDTTLSSAQLCRPPSVDEGQAKPTSFQDTFGLENQLLTHSKKKEKQYSITTSEPLDEFVQQGIKIFKKNETMAETTVDLVADLSNIIISPSTAIEKTLD